MMAHLRPEQRTDKNGRVVTRHVRNEPKAARSASNIPGPSLLSAAATPAARKPYTPRPKQTEVGHIGLFLPMDHAPSKELWDCPDEGEMVRYRRRSYGGTLSHVQFYEVASAVARPSDALKLVSSGARSADDARRILAERDAEHLSADMRAAADRALEVGLHPHDFIQWYPVFAEEGCRPVDVVDAARLGATSLWEDESFYDIARPIAAGDITFDDVKTVGITKLKGHKLLKHLQETFVLIHSTDGDAFTAEGLKEILRRAAEEKFDPGKYRQLGSLIEEVGTKRVEEVPSITSAVEAYTAFTSAIGRPEPWTNEEAAERAIYHAHLGDAVTIKDSKKWALSTEFYAAGIPTDIAREVILAGGTVATAQGIVDHGVAGAVADGWL